MRITWTLLAVTALLAATPPSAAAQTAEPSPTDFRLAEDSRPAAPATYDTPEPARMVRSSRYLTMRDGVRIAVDVYRPAEDPDRPRPTLVQQTRYWRTPDIRFPFSLFRSPVDLQGPLGQFKRIMVAAGYVWIDVDTRGSGASFGSRPWDYSPDEIQDGGDIADWIVAQPWSDGRIGTVGVSYSGSTAEFALINRHPAIQAAGVVSAEFDQYLDILAPGGIPLNFYMAEWGELTSSLDRNVIPGATWFERLASGGVAPVDGDWFAIQRGQAVRQHADNYDFRELLKVVFRDDLTIEAGEGASPGRLAAQAQSFAWLQARYGPDFRSRGIDLASTHAYMDDIRRAPAPVYAVTGWFDGTYANASAKRFNTLGRPGDRLIIGPWDHALHNISPWSGGQVTGFDLFGELLKFFEGTIGGDTAALTGQAPVHYYTMGAEEWRSSQVWPPASTPERVFLSGDRRLTGASDVVAGIVPYAVDFEATTGNSTRYDTLLGRALKTPYPNRAARDEKLLVFDGPVLEADVEVTGHPIANLWLTSTATDGAFFVYLEDVWPDGRVTYVTEGMLRGLHRRVSDAPAQTWSAGPNRTFLRADARPIVPGEPFQLTFDLLPTSYVFKAGHRVRIAIAGADAAHFARIPEDPTQFPVIEVLQRGEQASWVELPVVRP
ncbi:CocE/NonD family hydrolase [Brevundimonas sp.]|uniref:CocE/NonD family hydrolase n=1 Tax=Brevundimonas sp. TaxID=1871086 RepID=UPI002627FB3D|nr:CocE/NonD family hydrolase [Brevundimonas sp.]